MLQKEIEKNNEDQRKLTEMRANLKSKGIALEEPKYPTDALGQGHNPKESPQMYVEKILKNQKRIERTIQMYEENQKKS